MDEAFEDEIVTYPEEPEPVYGELVVDGENSAPLTEDVHLAFEEFERVEDANGEEALAFDVTLVNGSGEVFDPATFNVWVSYGSAGAEATDVPLERDEHGVSVATDFGAPIPGGESVTVRQAYAVPAQEERVTVRVQPWDVPGAAEVYLQGDVPV